LKRLREGNAGPRKCKGRQDAISPHPSQAEWVEVNALR
jgi:hypothetical protein